MIIITWISMSYILWFLDLKGLCILLGFLSSPLAVYHSQSTTHQDPGSLCPNQWSSNHMIRHSYGWKRVSNISLRGWGWGGGRGMGLGVGSGVMKGGGGGGGGGGLCWFMEWGIWYLYGPHVSISFQRTLSLGCPRVARWPSYRVRRYFHPHDIFTITIFSSPLRYFHPSLYVMGKVFILRYHSILSCAYTIRNLFYTFYDFLQIFVHHRLLIHSTNISTKTLSFNSKEVIMLKYNHFNPHEFHDVNIWIWIKKPGIIVESNLNIFKYNHHQCQILG